MGTATYAGPVPKDHPMFSGGPELFSLQRFNESSKTSASATDGVTPETSSPSSAAKTLVQDDPNRPETEEELEIRAGKQMMLGRKHQNEQFRQMSAAARNGTPWPPLRE